MSLPLQGSPGPSSTSRELRTAQLAWVLSSPSPSQLTPGRRSPALIFRLAQGTAQGLCTASKLPRGFPEGLGEGDGPPAFAPATTPGGGRAKRLAPIHGLTVLRLREQVTSPRPLGPARVPDPLTSVECCSCQVFVYLGGQPSRLSPPRPPAQGAGALGEGRRGRGWGMEAVLHTHSTPTLSLASAPAPTSCSFSFSTSCGGPPPIQHACGLARG